MIVLNEILTGTVVPDEELGTIEKVAKNVTYEWIVDQQEQSHIETIAEYANGGKDVRRVIDSPEVGHWRVTTDDGKELPIGDEVPIDWPKEAPIHKTVELNVYRPYTDEELAEIEEGRIASEKREAFMETAPERMDDAEMGVAELGVIAADNTATLDDVMLAIAELGARVESAKL